jgi:dihydrofolate synthase/folylpolyglutamate synthase
MAVTTYTEAVAFLDEHIGLGVRPGLERIRELLDLLAKPQDAYPIIHITGSNGKTSTARIATSLLAAHGLKVGTFTSPHLERVEERLSINNVPATGSEFYEAIADIEPFADLLEQRTGERPTYFELTAAAALAWFASRAVDVAVVEVGLGGRLDATNAADGNVAVVTGISLEHVGYLGETVGAIAREKLAIAKPGSALVAGPMPEDADRAAVEHADQTRIQLRRYGHDFRLADAVRAVGGWLCEVEGIYDTYEDLYLPLHGRHQTVNLAVALAAVEELFGRALSADAAIEGAAEASSPGRLEVLGHRPLVIVDGAHNDEGFRALTAALTEEFPPVDWTLVIGVLGDKDLDAIFDQLKGFVARVYATTPDSDRARPSMEIARAARRVLGPDVEVIETADVAAAVAGAGASMGVGEGLLVTGSLYVVGEARPLLQQTIAPSVNAPAGPPI